jgi:hypothetical protein
MCLCGTHEAWREFPSLNFQLFDYSCVYGANNPSTLISRRDRRSSNEFPVIDRSGLLVGFIAARNMLPEL